MIAHRTYHAGQLLNGDFCSSMPNRLVHLQRNMRSPRHGRASVARTHLVEGVRHKAQDYQGQT